MGMFRRQKQVDVVGHQRVGVKRALLFLQRFAQPVEVCLIIFFAKEARLAVVPALHDVQRYAIKMDAGRRGIGTIIANIIRPWPL